MDRKPTRITIAVAALALCMFLIAMACTNEPPPASTAPRRL